MSSIFSIFLQLLPDVCFQYNMYEHVKHSNAGTTVEINSDEISMTLYKNTLKFSLAFSLLSAVPTQATDFKYRKSVTLNVGQSIILKGVRSHNCGDKAPSWSRVRSRLPKTKLGKFSNGGDGFTDSGSCGGRVGARGILFTAKKPGKEQLTIYKDKVRITVN